MLIRPQAGQPARIKVVGLGGGGGNALATMIAEEDIKGVEFIAMNTDAQALLNHPASTKIQIGETLTKGLGSGGDPEIGRLAAEESKMQIQEHLQGADMVFIAAGQGGGTGTGAAPIVAEAAKEAGALTVAVVTKPFIFEGRRRQLAAEEGIEALNGKVDTLIIIPNQKVLEVIDAKVSMLEAFKKVDAILNQGVKGIAELITVPGLINVDFADVRAVMANAGTSLMGIGRGTGEKRTQMAIKQAISSPLLETSIQGAKGVLYNIVGGPDLSMSEVDEAATIISKTVDSDAAIFFGAVIDEAMAGEVKITLIATKFDDHGIRLREQFSDVRRQQQHEVMSEELGTTDDIDEASVSTKTRSDFKPSTDNIDDSDMSSDDGEFDIPTFLRRK